MVLRFQLPIKDFDDSIITRAIGFVVIEELTEAFISICNRQKYKGYCRRYSQGRSVISGLKGVLHRY